MQYRRDQTGRDISILGYGCMRFTASGGKIDLAKAEKEILAAIDRGVNYFDTAYIYPGSEATLGQILARNGLREKVSITTKLPHYLIKSRESAEKYLAEQLRRLQTDHVDYYLMHMLTDVKTWDRLKALGIPEWLEEKRRAGVIRQVGFSYHGNSDMFCRLADAYGWNLCQIQYNYLDEHSQAGVTGLRYAAKKGLPVIIMEPLRGGRLVNHLPAEALARFEAYPVRRSPAEWAFRWLWDQPEVTCVLSGMNSLEMVEENCRAASEARPGEFGESEQRLIQEVVAAINAKMKVGCTGCRYCMPCPHGVDIPGVFAAYNRRATDGLYVGLREFFMCTALRKDFTGPSQCVGCGKCEKHCPQGIAIRAELKNAGKALHEPLVHLAARAARLVMKY